MPDPITLHGIRNCDTMKRARAWLDGQGIAYAFHDYKKDGVPEGLLEGWAAKLGWTALINRSGTTFRKLPESETRELDEARGIALMRANASMIRRPVLVRGDLHLVGFSAESYAAALTPAA